MRTLNEQRFIHPSSQARQNLNLLLDDDQLSVFHPEITHKLGQLKLLVRGRIGKLLLNLLLNYGYRNRHAPDLEACRNKINVPVFAAYASAQGDDEILPRDLRCELALDLIAIEYNLLIFQRHLIGRDSRLGPQRGCLCGLRIRSGECCGDFVGSNSRLHTSLPALVRLLEIAQLTLERVRIRDDLCSGGLA